MITKRDDLAMINNPRQWPCWPFLPVKKDGYLKDDKCLGVLLDERGPVVYHVNLFALPQSVDAWNAADRTVYASIEEMLADGWMVD